MASAAVGGPWASCTSARPGWGSPAGLPGALVGGLGRDRIVPGGIVEDNQ
jgi:hypothetical protein